MISQFCQQVLFNIIPNGPTQSTALVMGLVSLSGLILLGLVVAQTSLLIRKVLQTKVALPTRVKVISRRLKLANKVDVVKDDRMGSFCYGLINPRICLSLKLINNLSDRELKAVLLHESYHLHHKDPLKIALVQVVSAVLFFVPIIRDIVNYYLLSKELAADQLAIQHHSAQDLRSALIKALQPAYALKTVAYFGYETTLEQRVRALTGTGSKLIVQTSPFRVSISLLVILVTVMLLSRPAQVQATPDQPLCPNSQLRLFTPSNYSPSN